MNDQIPMTGADAIDPAVAGGLGVGIVVLYLGIFLFIGFCFYKIFQKAGREDAWAGFIPIYNLVVLLQVVGKPLWWIVMLFIPCVNIVALVLINLELGKCFGKTQVWSIIFLVLLSIIGLPMLAFGSDQYTAPENASTSLT